MQDKQVHQGHMTLHTIPVPELSKAWHLVKMPTNKLYVLNYVICPEMLQILRLLCCRCYLRKR